MNFLELVQKTGYRLDVNNVSTIEGSTSTEVSRIKESVNEAYNLVWSKLFKRNQDAEIETTLTLESGTDNYAIPDALIAVDMVIVDDNSPSAIMPWREFERDYKRAGFLVTTSSLPDVCAIYQNRIYFYPAPDTSYTVTIRGKAKFTELALDADEPLLKAEYHRAIKNLALYFEFLYEGNPQLQDQKEIVKEWLGIAGNNMNPHGDLPPRIMCEEEIMMADDRRMRL